MGGFTMSSRKTILRFFLTYLCVLIPMLALNFISQRAVLNQAQRRTDETVLWQLQQVSDEIAALAQRTDDFTIRLGTDDLLSAKRVLGSQTGARKAINLMCNAMLYDDSLSDIFLFYNSGYIYSTDGKTNTATFMTSLLSLDEASCARALELLFSGKSGVSCIWTSTGEGMLMVHEPINRLQMSYETMSINFLIPLKSLTQAAAQISSSALDGLNITLSDGSGASFIQDEDGKIFTQVLDPDRIGEPSLDISAYDGISISAHYSHSQMYGDIQRTQAIGTFMLCIGMLLSALVSLVLSRRRYQQLHEVEEYVQGMPEMPARPSGEFGVILSQVRQLRDKQDDLERSLIAHRCTLQSQIALILFESSGAISDADTLNSLLRECGAARGEEYFYVGALCVSSPAVNLAEAPLGGRLFCEVRHAGRRVLLFLGEVPHGDSRQTLRRADAQPLLDKFRGWSPLMAASQVYQPLTMISFACQEALSRLEAALTDGEEGFVCCMPPEEQRAPSDHAWFNTEQISRFAETMARGSWAEAAECFDGMMTCIDAHSGAAECDYLRSCILQAALPILQEAGRDEAVNTLSTLDPKSPDFAAAVRSLLRAACREPDAEKNDIFSRVVAFVDAHYAENDLSYERVADYAGVSKTYLSRLFRANVGMSYIDYLSRIRLTKADELIRTSDMTLRDITHTVGYLDESSFRRKYRAFFGYSVTDVRRAHPDAEEADAAEIAES